MVLLIVLGMVQNDRFVNVYRLHCGTAFDIFYRKPFYLGASAGGELLHISKAIQSSVNHAASFKNESKYDYISEQIFESLTSHARKHITRQWMSERINSLCKNLVSSGMLSLLNWSTQYGNTTQLITHIPMVKRFFTCPERWCTKAVCVHNATCKAGKTQWGIPWAQKLEYKS